MRLTTLLVALLLTINRTSSVAIAEMNMSASGVKLNDVRRRCVRMALSTAQLTGLRAGLGAEHRLCLVALPGIIKEVKNDHQ